MERVKIIIFILLNFSATLVFSQAFPTGLEFEDENYSIQPVVSLQDGGKTIPSSVDLSVYTPFPRHQGSIYSCVGWSIGYGALTIERAIKNGWTDRKVITDESSSALFLYNQIKIGNCNRGARITDALTLLQDKGDCLAKYYDKNLDDCEQPTTPELLVNASKFKISDYAALFDGEIENSEKIIRLKKALAQNKPIIVGMRIKNNFYKLEDAAFWHPDLGDTTYAGGHAMVVIGYDDHLASFRIFNSWGTKWGKNGTIWVKYSEFAKYCKYAYIIYIGNNPISSPLKPLKVSPVVASSNEVKMESKLDDAPLREIAGKFNFLRFTGNFNSSSEAIFEEASVSGDKNVYKLVNRNWQVGDKFQLQIVPDFSNGYIYVLSVDPNNKKEIHWPQNELLNEKFKGEFQSALSPFSGGVIKIPDAISVLKLSHSGLENLIILFSEKKIQTPFLQYLKDNLNNTPSSENLFKTLSEILGEHQIPSSEVHFDSNSMQFKAITRNSGAIIPIVLKISVI